MAANTESHSGSLPTTPTRKRKRNVIPRITRQGGKPQVIDLTQDEHEEDETTTKSSKKRKAATPRVSNDEEKRLRVFRKHPPHTYLEKLSRALVQRMFIIDRKRGGTEETPEETIEMAGSTGNIYTVTINQLPSCTCPDNQKGSQCKHIVYVLHNVLKAPSHLQYQLAFLSSELREIFSLAPPPPSSSTPSPSSPSQPSNRKPVDGDCPICFTAFEGKEEIVWCKAACGNNIHKGCFEQWARSQKGKEVRCVYCRTAWQGDLDAMDKIKVKGKLNSEGYINVAQELGLSESRDYSSYHQPWVRRNFNFL